MTSPAHLVQRSLLDQFVPLNSLSSDSLDDLSRKMSVEHVPAGGTLFSIGDRDNRTVYLLSGELELRKDREEPRRLRAGTPEACHPVAHQQPRNVSALALTDVEVLRIDNRLLDMMMTWDQSAGYVVAELAGDDNPADPSDWMTRMLQSSIFYQVPPANIQELFKRMQPVSLAAGDKVIRQGEVGDFYYVINRGRVVVTRTAPNGVEVQLAKLGPGEGFGEEALISDAPRNATVSMSTDGVLMRLSKEDFDELLKGPVLQEIDFEEGNRLVTEEGAVWLDVRLEAEHENLAIPGSVNIPLCLLRLRSRELDPDTLYLVYCDSGQRSAAAAYLLSETGFEVCVLAGGYREAGR